MSDEGLRERKKRRTRRQIRDVTLRLIDEQGFAATTVEQIAEACEIAPSTFFRYFRNKEEAATADFLDVSAYEDMRGSPPEMPLLELLVSTLEQLFGAMTDEEWRTESLRMRVLQREPELRERMMVEFTRPIALAQELLTQRGYGRELGAVVAGAVVGAISTFFVTGTGAEQGFTVPATRDDAIAAFRRAVELVGRVVVVPPPDAPGGGRQPEGLSM